jgi:hypothetical protein
MGLIVTAICLMLGACAAEPDVRDEARQLQYYYDTYDDTYAALLLRQMYEAGDITADDYKGDMAARGDSFDDTAIAQYHQLSQLLNGRLETLTCEDFSINVSLLMADLYDYGVSISLFNNQQTRNRLERAIGAVNSWLNQPDENNTKTMEDMITRRDITPGEIVFLYYYMFNSAGRLSGPILVDGQTYDFYEYADARMIDQKSGLTLLTLQEEAAAKLRQMNRCAIEE